jgi:hypothetical protein
MLWEMLAGRRMWHGKTEVDIVGHLASGKPFPPLPLDASLPTALDAICTRALECDPAQRYQTAAEFEMDLERVLVGAADSHARNLGQVVSLAFSEERAERQAVIERSLSRSAASPTPVATPAVRMVETRELTGIDITVGEFQVGATTSIVKAPGKAPNALRWWRAVALSSLAVTSFAAMLLLGAWRRAPAAAAVEAPRPAAGAAAVVPTPAPATWWTVPVGRSAVTKSATRRSPPTSHPIVAAGSAQDGTEHHRQHRRSELSDDDAPMPPSADLRP